MSDIKSIESETPAAVAGAAPCSASDREHEIHALRTKLYNAAYEYTQAMMNTKHTLDEIMRLSNELEAAAEAWAFR